jgi:hypothetical protein
MKMTTAWRIIRLCASLSKNFVGIFVVNFGETQNRLDRRHRRPLPLSPPLPGSGL